MSPEIEKGIARPKPVHPRLGKSKYPFKDMEVGDSVLFERPRDPRLLRTAAHQYGKKHGKKFSCHKVPEGLRIWRTQ